MIGSLPQTIALLQPQMASLKAMLEQKRKLVEQTYGARKTLKATALDTAHMSKIREQEQAERQLKVRDKE